MLLSVMLSSTLAIVPQRQPQQLRPSPAALARAADAQAPPPFNATSSSTWLTQMSDQVHHALVEAKKLEQRVAAANAADTLVLCRHALLHLLRAPDSSRWCIILRSTLRNC